LRSRAALASFVAALAASACASTGTRNAEQLGRLGETLMRGPDSLESPVARVLWSATVGMLTLPIWLPLMALRAEDPGAADLRVPVDDPAARSIDELDFGSYHALVIGNDDYQYLRDLKTAMADAEAVADRLRGDYGFSVTLLENATLRDILTALQGMRGHLDSTENLLIYYAGHGYLDGATSEGYWLPVDARPDDPTDWLPNKTLATMLKGIDAKHVLVVADSCFSGSLNRSTVMERNPPSYIYRLASKRARVVMTSGGLEPVQDEGGGGNSVFAAYFLRALAENRQLVVEGSDLFLRIRRPVIENAHQTPEYGLIHQAGHDGGDFLFVRRAAALDP
jgi:uncharacterized caspase-like protein